MIIGEKRYFLEFCETDYDIPMLFDSDAVWTEIYDIIMDKHQASLRLRNVIATESWLDVPM